MICGWFCKFTFEIECYFIVPIHPKLEIIRNRVESINELYCIKQREIMKDTKLFTVLFLTMTLIGCDKLSIPDNWPTFRGNRQHTGY